MDKKHTPKQLQAVEDNLQEQTEIESTSEVIVQFWQFVIQWLLHVESPLVFI